MVDVFGTLTRQLGGQEAPTGRTLIKAAAQLRQLETEAAIGRDAARNFGGLSSPTESGAMQKKRRELLQRVLQLRNNLSAERSAGLDDPNHPLQGLVALSTGNVDSSTPPSGPPDGKIQSYARSRALAAKTLAKLQGLPESEQEQVYAQTYAQALLQGQGMAPEAMGTV